MKKILLLLAAVGTIFTACQSGGDVEDENGGTPSTPKIELSQQTIDVGFEAATYSVSVTSPYSWDATTKNDWIVVDSETGIAGTEELKFSVSRNEVMESREGTIVIKNSDYNLIAELYVIQKGVSAESKNMMFYTSSDGSVVEPYETNVFGANIVSNTYANGKGVIVFDAPVTEIGYFAFRYCTSLTSITIPDSVTEIGSSAFSNCDSLTSVTIPDSVTSIGDCAFRNCTSLKAFYGKYASSDNRCLIVDGVLNSFAPAGLTEYTIPDSVTSIGEEAFYKCTSLTSITIPDSVTSIGVYAFAYCTSLTSVTIPDSVTSIGYAAFCECTSLTSITIPNSITSIGGYAFSGCTSLKEVYCKPTTPPAGNSYMFNNNATERKIYVPRNSVSAYKAKRYWSDYTDSIVGYDF